VCAGGGARRDRGRCGRATTTRGPRRCRRRRPASPTGADVPAGAGGRTAPEGPTRPPGPGSARRRRRASESSGSPVVTLCQSRRPGQESSKSAARLTASAPARSVATRTLTGMSDARWEVPVSQTRGGRHGGGRGPHHAVTLRARLSALYPGTSGRRLKQWLEGGRVQVNGEVVRRGDASVVATDRVELAAPPPAPFP